MTLIRQAVGSLRNVDPCLVQLFPTNCNDIDDPHETDNCCTLIPCCLCFTLTDYAGDIFYGEACWDDTFKRYQGFIDGETGIGARLFTFDWDRNENEECEHVVTFDGEEIYREDWCHGGDKCENPEGSAQSVHGVITWERQHRHWRKIWDSDGSDCETFCPKCRCAANKICVTWNRLGNDCTDPCLESVLEAEWDCENDQFGPIIFEPDCNSDEDPVSIAIRLMKDSFGECIWVLEVDGGVEDELTTEETNDGLDCKNPHFEFEYTDESNGCTVTVTTAGRQCGCQPPPRQICCCPDRDPPEELYVTLREVNDCSCVDGAEITLSLQYYIAPLTGSGAGGYWEGEGEFCSPYTGNACTIRIGVTCQPSPSCVWELNYCTGSDDGCGDLEVSCQTLLGGTPGGTCDGLTELSPGDAAIGCEPLELVFAGGTHSDNCCCNPQLAASDFCFAVRDYR